MTLGRYAAIVGAAPRWVQNARQVLGLRRAYSLEEARHLGLARMISEGTGVPLGRAWGFAHTALSAPGNSPWTWTSDDGVVDVVIDVARYLSAFGARLSAVITSYEPRVRGPRRARSRNPITAAQDYGVDTTLLIESLRLTPAERLAHLDNASEFIRTLRVVKK